MTDKSEIGHLHISRPEAIGAMLRADAEEVANAPGIDAHMRSILSLKMKWGAEKIAELESMLIAAEANAKVLERLRYNLIEDIKRHKRRLEKITDAFARGQLKACEEVLDFIDDETKGKTE